ncbi:DUF4179 domain-containing protein [Clostridium sp. SHJSY1]|uniref:DUF4179 domain-containing protein n=1 Tax=Clostridium sp. SHJSY1 TaxID=2942483 RepID=UPI002876B36F|nr:DUF4179 domain-containing protein [Clostridium sp. SHJSY1]MDS0527634.1 DUF4179 domain-containing protein [Clostridium sp. SHJSY1]
MINNEFLNIEISEGLDRAIDKGIERASTEIKVIKYRKRKIVVSSIAAIIIGFFTFGITNPAVASKMPILGGVFESIEKNIHFTGNYSEYATAINETVESNGVKVTLSEILCDGEGLYVTYKVESEKPFKYTSWDDKPLDMNQLITKEAYNKVSFSNKELEGNGLVGLEGKFVDDNTFIGMKTYHLNSLEKEVPNEFDFLIKFTSIGTSALKEEDKDQNFTGTWAFKIPVKVNKSISKNIEINEREDNGFILNSITITPFQMTIVNTNPDKKFYGVRVIDDNNTEIHCDSGKISDENKQTIYFGSVPKESKSLRIIIYRNKMKLKETIEKSDGDYDTTYENEGEEIMLDKIINID